MQKLKVAVISSKSKFCDIDGNLTHFNLLIQKASSKKAKLICFPELALSSYTNKKNILDVAQKIPGPITDELQVFTKKYGDTSPQYNGWNYGNGGRGPGRWEHAQCGGGSGRCGCGCSG